jgi:hypothetical protein
MDAEITISGASGYFGAGPPSDVCDKTMADLNNTYIIPGPFPITDCLEGASPSIDFSHCIREIDHFDGSISFLPYDRFIDLAFSIGCRGDVFAGPVSCRTRVNVALSDLGFPGSRVWKFRTDPWTNVCLDLCDGASLNPLHYFDPFDPAAAGPFNVTLAFV